MTDQLVSKSNLLDALETYWADICEEIDTRPVVTDSHDGPIYSVDAQGWSEQDGTPTPDNPVEIEVARGRNLLNTTFENGGIGEDGTNSNSGTVANYRRTVSKVPVSGSTEYALSLPNLKNVSGLQVYTVEYDSGETFISNSRVARYNGNSFGGCATFTTTSSTKFVRAFVYSSSLPNDPVGNAQLELGSTPHPYLPYGHVGLEVQGRNLFDAPIKSGSKNGVTFNWDSGSSVVLSGTSTGGIFNDIANFITKAKSGEEYVLSLRKNGVINPGQPYLNATFIDSGGNSTGSVKHTDSSGFVAFTVPSDAVSIQIQFCILSGYNVSGAYQCQLELGSTATDYEPYYHATVPIPLPSKGWAGGLPDGTADALAIDSAGRWEWVIPTAEKVLNGTESWSKSSNTTIDRFLLNGVFQVTRNGSDYAKSSHYRLMNESSVIGDFYQASGAISDGGDRIIVNHSAYGVTTLNAFKTWLSTHNVTVLHLLATPTTESGYIADWPVDIPEGSTITIPELEDVGVRCFVVGAKELAINAANWGHRAREQESRIAALEAAVAELATS